MEKLLRQTYLLDFYGDLLTPHQRAVFEDVVCNDISCSEVAAREGVSRQSINELVHKCTRLLESYEEKLHMMERFLRLRTLTSRLEKQLAAGEAKGLPPEDVRQMRSLCRQILEEL